MLDAPAPRAEPPALRIGGGNAHPPLQPDAAAIGAFVGALFRYAEPGTFASLRAFRDADDGVFRIAAHRIGKGLADLAEAATREAARSASAPFPVVFCPPVATFASPDKATEAALADGLALSVECDATPGAARARLEALLGPATVVVASGGEWTNPSTGEVEPKAHLHWRLTEPTREPADHARLKEARSLATALVGGDASNKPAVHPIRWPGSWHRKGAPKLARIIDLHEDAEIELSDALETLREAAGAAGIGTIPAGAPGISRAASFSARVTGPGEARSTAELVRAVLAAEDYHGPLAALAMRLLSGGTPDGQAVALLRGIMLAVPVAERDMKGGTAEPGRWQSRFDDIPRAVSTARAKVGAGSGTGVTVPGGTWPAPLDFLADGELSAAPELRLEHLPDALAPFVFDTAGRMGVDPAAVALAALVSLAAIINEGWRIQPKRNDTDWTEQARLWGAIVGPPSILKSPVIRAATRPLDRIETEARTRHAEAMRAWRLETAALKADKVPPTAWPPQPRCERWIAEGTTVEALSEILRDDDEARFRTPAGKLLVRQDELSEWVAGLDQYKAGGRGGADRGAYLRIYNGGGFTVDRIGRGSFALPNWSACILGGIQPEPIQRIASQSADDGLLQRFLFIVPASQREGEDRAPDEAAGRGYDALFRALHVLHPPRFLSGETKPVRLAEGAHAHREAVNTMTRAAASWPDTSARLQAALGKWPGTFARLLLTFHLVEHAAANARGETPPLVDIVSEDTARRVAGLMRDVLLPHLLRAEGMLYQSAQTSHAAWIAGYILASATARDTGRITARDIQRAYKPLRAPERRRELTAVMDSLEIVGWVRAELPDNIARPIMAWAVNPALHTTFAERAAAERRRRDAARESTAGLIRGRTERPA